MPGPRLSKSIARWVAVNQPRRPAPLRRAVRHGYLAAIGVAAAWLAWSAVNGDRTIYRAGPLARAHQSFAHQCGVCHQDAWQGLSRLATLDNSHTSTPNTACQSCHPGAKHNDHALAAAHQCADCHREHRGDQRLVRVNQQLCVECHGDLRTDETPPRSFARAVADFRSHPQFALFREDGHEAPGADHLVHAVAARETGDEGSRWVDEAELRFNHKAHLNPDGVLLPVAEGEDSVLRNREELTCQSCHKPDAERRYMLAVRYDAHCQRCHPLEFTVEIERQDVPRTLVIPLPHREPNLVRGAIRQQLSQAFSTWVLAREDGAGDESLSPGDELLSKPGLPRPRPVLNGELTWVNELLSAADHAVFGNEAKGGCRFCHTVTGSDQSWQIVPPDVPGRWFLHSRFDHRRHRTLSCDHCHAAAASTSKSDVLLPKIEVCQSCHRPSDGQGGGGARTDCVECHDYHGRQNANIVQKAPATSSSE